MADQIQSIQKQTFTNWRLLVRDDGSEDNTINILRELQQIDSRIELITDSHGRLGTVSNYKKLCEIALAKDAQTIFFCDQDDVWLPEKIELQLNIMRQMERKHGKNCPIMIHADLLVVKADLDLISNSFFRYQHIKNIKKNPLCILLAQNYITACVSTCNRALLNLATPLPDCAVMHDWWFAICAAACGKIGFIDKPLVLYRQHGANTIGAKGFLNGLIPNNNLNIRYHSGKDNFIQSVYQASQLKERIQNREANISSNEMNRIEAYSKCLEMKKVRRWRIMTKYGIRRQGIVYQLLFYFLLFTTPYQERRFR